MVSGSARIETEAKNGDATVYATVLLRDGNFRAHMLRRFFNLLGLCLFAAAFITAVLDAQHSYTAAKLTLAPVGGALATLAPQKWAAAQSFAGRYISLTNVMIAGFLRLPMWLPLCVAGTFFAWLGKKPRPKFGYSSR